MAKDTIQAILEWYEVEPTDKETIVRYVNIAAKDGLITPQEKREIEWFVKTRLNVKDCVC